MKKLFEPTHIDLLNEFDTIKSIIKNEKIPQFNIVGIKNKISKLGSRMRHLVSVRAEKILKK